MRFVLTDFAHTVPVEYTGVLPDLFREGQGIIAHGTMGSDGAFVADEVLAKHDEKYMPPEVAASLKQKAGYKAPAAGPTPAALRADRLVRRAGLSPWYRNSGNSLSYWPSC